jgi:hypothetical protein
VLLFDTGFRFAVSDRPDPWMDTLGFTDLGTEQRERAIDHIKTLI